MTSTEPILYLHTKEGDLCGVQLSPEAWKQVEVHVTSVLCGEEADACEMPEPMQDWQDLQDYWDFRYPPNFEVECELCGSKTSNWEEDSPRLFRLKACNIGGLLRFRCQRCKADITKRHFKDHIKTVCRPFQDDE